MSEHLHELDESGDCTFCHARELLELLGGIYADNLNPAESADLILSSEWLARRDQLVRQAALLDAAVELDEHEWQIHSVRAWLRRRAGVV